MPDNAFSHIISFFFNDTATTEIYTLSLHDALPISTGAISSYRPSFWPARNGGKARRDRKSTRLNSSHITISYAVFCLKKKKNHLTDLTAVTLTADNIIKSKDIVKAMEVIRKSILVVLLGGF